MKFLIILLVLFSFAAAAEDYYPRRCGEHKVFPYTDYEFCLRHVGEAKDICSSLAELQREHTKIRSICVRTERMLDNLRVQFIRAKNAELAYLRLDQLRCIDEKGVEWCGEPYPVEINAIE